jgi:hypothetical protein
MSATAGSVAVGLNQAALADEIRLNLQIATDMPTARSAAKLRANCRNLYFFHIP